MSVNYTCADFMPSWNPNSISRNNASIATFRFILLLPVKITPTYSYICFMLFQHTRTQTESILVKKHKYIIFYKLFRKTNNIYKNWNNNINPSNEYNFITII